MKFKRQKPIKFKCRVFARGWGVSKRHSEPFAKRDLRRRFERLFVIQAKQESLQ